MLRIYKITFDVITDEDGFNCDDIEVPLIQSDFFKKQGLDYLIENLKVVVHRTKYTKSNKYRKEF